MTVGVRRPGGLGLPQGLCLAGARLLCWIRGDVPNKAGSKDKREQGAWEAPGEGGAQHMSSGSWKEEPGAHRRSRC